MGRCRLGVEILIRNYLTGRLNHMIAMVPSACKITGASSSNSIKGSI